MRAISRRWRALSRRRRVALGLLAGLAVVLAGWLAFRPETWPARAVLRSEGDTWPLAFSPDGKAVVTSNPDGITLWDAATGRVRTTWPLPGGVPTGIAAFSPDGRTLCAVGYDRAVQAHTIHLVDFATGRVRASLATRQPYVLGVAFSADGQSFRAVLESRNGPREVVAWDVATGQEQSSFLLPGPASRGRVAISPDGRVMATATVPPSSRGDVMLWDPETGRQLALMPAPAMAAPEATALAISPDGSTLAVGRYDGTIDIWDTKTHSLRAMLRGHSANFASWMLAFGRDGTTLASSGLYHYSGRTLPTNLLRLLNRNRERWEVVVLDVVDGRHRARTESGVQILLSPDGRTLATRENDLAVRLRDVPATSPRLAGDRVVAPPPGHGRDADPAAGDRPRPRPEGLQALPR